MDNYVLLLQSKKERQGTSLAVQWLRRHASTAGSHVQPLIRELKKSKTRVHDYLFSSTGWGHDERFQPPNQAPGSQKGLRSPHRPPKPPRWSWKQPRARCEQSDTEAGTEKSQGTKGGRNQLCKMSGDVRKEDDPAGCFNSFIDVGFTWQIIYPF